MSSEGCFNLEIANAEQKIFSGKAKRLFATGLMGELEILYGHAPLLTALEPGPVWIVKDNNEEEAFVINGGMLEVQPKETLVLADAAIFAEDIDEAAVLKAKERAEAAVAKREAGFDYEKAHFEIQMAAAQLRMIKKLREKLK